VATLGTIDARGVDPNTKSSGPPSVSKGAAARLPARDASSLFILESSRKDNSIT
jgi:hypothetical protein